MLASVWTRVDASGKQVSADHLQAGLYILRATDGNQSFVQKVVVR